MQVPVGLIQFGLTALGPWMTPFALLLSAYQEKMNFFCASDPPPVPDFSTFNPLDLVGGVFNPNFEAARLLLLHAFQNWLWYRFCYCSSGALIQQPVTIVPPPTSTSATSLANTTPCFTGGWGGLPPNLGQGGVDPGRAINVSQQILPVGPGRLTITVFPTPITVFEVPRGLSEVVGSGSAPTIFSNAFGPLAGVNLMMFDAVGRELATQAFDGSAGNRSFSKSFAVDPAWMFWYAFAYQQQGFGDPPVTDPMQLSTQVFCGGTGPFSLSSCCPPDPTIANMLQAILASFQGIPSAGGLPPGSYVDSIVHQGLSGLGAIPVQRQTVAVRVVITTDNNQLPVGAGDPPYLFDRGFIVPFVATGAVRGNVRLVYNPQLYVLPQLTEQIGYTLTDGLVASITELVPGP